MPKATYQVKRSHTLLQRRCEHAMPITQSEWCRVKDMVSKIKKPNHKFGYLASIMLGVLPSSFFAIITFDSETQVWYRVTVLCLFIISFVLSITFYFIHKGQDDVNGVMGQDILHEMHMIEDQFKSSVSDGSEIPL